MKKSGLQDNDLTAHGYQHKQLVVCLCSHRVLHLPAYNPLSGARGLTKLRSIPIPMPIPMPIPIPIPIRTFGDNCRISGKLDRKVPMPSGNANANLLGT